MEKIIEQAKDLIHNYRDKHLFLFAEKHARFFNKPKPTHVDLSAMKKGLGDLVRQRTLKLEKKEQEQEIKATTIEEPKEEPQPAISNAQLVEYLMPPAGGSNKDLSSVTKAFPSPTRTKTDKSMKSPSARKTKLAEKVVGSFNRLALQQNILNSPSKPMDGKQQGSETGEQGKASVVHD